MAHDVRLIRNVFASYLTDFGEGYDRTTFFQYIAVCIFSENEKKLAAEALKQAARNLEWQSKCLKEPHS